MVLFRSHRGVRGIIFTTHYNNSNRYSFKSALLRCPIPTSLSFHSHSLLKLSLGVGVNHSCNSPRCPWLSDGQTAVYFWNKEAVNRSTEGATNNVWTPVRRRACLSFGSVEVPQWPCDVPTSPFSSDAVCDGTEDRPERPMTVIIRLRFETKDWSEMRCKVTELSKWCTLGAFRPNSVVISPRIGG